VSPPIATPVDTPRLFPIEVHDHRGRTIEDVVLEALTDGGTSICPVCAAPTTAVPSGVRCDTCGSEVLAGAEPAPAWVA
jgi:hypothetical protein